MNSFVRSVDSPECVPVEAGTFAPGDVDDPTAAGK